MNAFDVEFLHAVGVASARRHDRHIRKLGNRGIRSPRKRHYLHPLDSGRLNRTEHVFAFNLLRMQKLVETQLAEEAACFIRIGKSLIINRNYIYKINLTKQELVLSDSRLDGAFRLSASREALRQLKELLEKEAGL